MAAIIVRDLSDWFERMTLYWYYLHKNYILLMLLILLLIEKLSGFKVEEGIMLCARLRYSRDVSRHERQSDRISSRFARTVMLQ